MNCFNFLLPVLYAYVPPEHYYSPDPVQSSSLLEYPTHACIGSFNYALVRSLQTYHVS